MTKAEILFNSLGEAVTEAVKGNLFGKPCFKINGKAFICFFQDEMVCKLTEEPYREALSLDGSQLFDPSGKKRPMKEWVQVPFEYSDKWAGFVNNAADYVGKR